MMAMKRTNEKRQKRLRRKRHIRKTLSGTSARPRLTVFRSNKNLYAQVIDDTKGHTLVSISTLEKELRELSNTRDDAAKIGEELGKRMLEKEITNVVFDRNGYLYHGVVKALADGARKAGVKF